MVDVYKALADPTRRAILDALVETDGQTLFSLCTKVTARQEADLSRQAISQHLAILEEAGLLRTEKRGRFKLHFVDTTPLTEIGRRWPVTREET